MKKIFTLLTVLLCALMANAQTYQFYYNGKTEVMEPQGFFVKSATWNPNTKYTGTIVIADGSTVECKQGIKMEGATDIGFSTERTATVKIVQSLTSNDSKNIKFDGETLTDGVDNPEGFKTSRVFTITGVAVGDHHITRGNGETGIIYVCVTLDELKGEQLPAPEITFVKTTGEVTIAPVANATKVVYTTDGSFPTDESTEYTAPFTVADGTVVKAMAIGDGENYANSSVAEVEVLLEGLTCEAPVFAQFNGTFALSTETKLASCEYSLDGTTWVAYTMPVTLTETATVKARSVRANWTNSEVAEAEVVALPALKGTKRVYLGGGAFEIVAASADKGGVLKGIADGEADGYSIEINVANKGWGKGEKVTVAADTEYTTYYGSNGAQNVLNLPEGVTVKRVTFFSYMPALGRVSGWNEVAGETYNQYKEIPLASQNTATPDVRIFDLNDVTGSFTFAQTGERPNFMIALDIVDPDAEPEPGNNFGDAALAAPSVYPTNNSTMMQLAGGINLTFEAEVQAEGKATLGDKEVALIAVDNQVFIPYEGLEPLTEYVLTIPAGSIGNAEAQNQEDLVYTFTTRMADVLFYADFNVYPEGYYNEYTSKFTGSTNIDIIKKNATTEVNVGGMIFHGEGSNGRIVAMNGGNILESDTETDGGASARCIQMIAGSNKLYVEFPAIEGPAEVTFYIGNAGSKTGSFFLTDENGDVANPLATFEFANANKTMHKFTYSYPYKGSVNLRLYNNGVQLNVNDALFIKGEGEGIDKPVYKDEEAPVLAFSWPSAAPYAPVEGNIVLIYNEPIVAAAKAVVNGVETEITVDDKTATIAYAGLEKGKTYTVEIPAIADEAGNATEPFTMTLATEAETTLFYTDFNYFPYSYWDAFHMYPMDGADNGDILAKNSTDQKVTFGGITYEVGATAGRVVAMGKSNLLGTTDEENLGATARCIQISGGGDALYAELPSVQGPAEITLWVGNSAAKEGTFELRNGASVDALATFDLTAEKKMFKFSYKFVPTEEVAFRIYNMGNQFNIHDILVVKADTGSSAIDAIAAAADEAPVVYYNLQGQRVANPAAGLYIRVQGTDVKKVIL